MTLARCMHDNIIYNNNHVIIINDDIIVIDDIIIIDNINYNNDNIIYILCIMLFIYIPIVGSISQPRKAKNAPILLQLPTKPGACAGVEGWRIYF